MHTYNSSFLQLHAFTGDSSSYKFKPSVLILSSTTLAHKNVTAYVLTRLWTSYLSLEPLIDGANHPMSCWVLNASPSVFLLALLVLEANFTHWTIYLISDRNPREINMDSGYTGSSVYNCIAHARSTQTVVDKRQMTSWTLPAMQMWKVHILSLSGGIL